MTEQEAEVLAARLSRIWEPERERFHLARYGKFSFVGEWASGLYLRIELEDEFSFELVQDNMLLLTLYCDEFSDESTFETSEKKRRSRQELVARWLPYFRRSCWLSGGDIEVTGQEKAEWMREFSREEIEAWDLER